VHVSVVTSEWPACYDRVQVIVNLYSAHMDPEVWEEPYVFRPERFLNEDGQVTGKERIIPFSLGTSCKTSSAQ